MCVPEVDGSFNECEACSAYSRWANKCDDLRPKKDDYLKEMEKILKSCVGKEMERAYKKISDECSLIDCDRDFLARGEYPNCCVPFDSYRRGIFEIDCREVHCPPDDVMMISGNKCCGGIRSECPNFLPCWKLKKQDLNLWKRCCPHCQSVSCRDCLGGDPEGAPVNLNQASPSEEPSPPSLDSPLDGFCKVCCPPFGSSFPSNLASF